jgi:rare lipoprotein A (peptidoglycan hydrolase)
MMMKIIRIMMVGLLLASLSTQTLAKPKKHTTEKHHVVKTKKVKHHKVKHKVHNPYVGTASWYGPKFHGHKTSSGERYNQHGLTAAHRSIPLNSKVKVTNLHNNKSVVVRINDRGPWVKNRIVDLSKGAALALNMDGLAQVKLTVID